MEVNLLIINHEYSVIVTRERVGHTDEGGRGENEPNIVMLPRSDLEDDNVNVIMISRDYSTLDKSTIEVTPMSGGTIYLVFPKY